VISVKHAATDTQREEEGAVAISFPEIKAEQEVSCTSLCSLFQDFQTPWVLRTFWFVLYT
jgi:hypothetical protein